MKRFLFLLVFILNFASLTFAAGPVNTVSLTSYYPAPFGAYDRMRLVPRGTLGATCLASEEGTLYIPTLTNVINQCRGGNWVPIGDGLWQVEPTPGNIATHDTLANIDQYFLRAQNGTPGYWNDNVSRPYVGIGTSFPTTYLHIFSSANDPAAGISPIYIRLHNGNSTPNAGVGPGAQIAFAGNSGDNVRLRALFTNTDAFLGPNVGSSLGFFLREETNANLNERFRMLGNGYFGIRDTAPSAILELAGNALIGPPAVANTLPYLMISSNNAAARNGDVLTILADGRVGINTTAPEQKLDVNGNIRATTLILTSDAALKKDIAPVKNALDKISRLNGVSFEWKDLSQKTDGRKHLGVLAQEVEKIFPESVYGQEGAKGVDYPSLIAPLIEAVKELKTQNQTLDQQLKEQSRQILEQQQQIESLKNARTIRKPVLTP